MLRRSVHCLRCVAGLPGQANHDQSHNFVALLHLIQVECVRSAKCRILNAKN